MRDNELSILLSGFMDEAAISSGWNFLVVQNNQPTQQGVPTEPTAFFQHVIDHPYGWPISNHEYNFQSGDFNDISTQLWETTFQISSLVLQDPANISRPTAKDVVNYIKQYMAHRNTIERLMSQSINILKIGNVRNHYFEDDMHRFEDYPNFDLTFTHNKQLTLKVPAVHSAEAELIKGV